MKGAKEGDGFSGCIMGCAIVDVGVNLSTEKPTKWGDVITVAASPELPNIGDVKKKLLLGSLKKMKEEGVSEVSSGIPEDKVDRISLLENCLFQVKERANGMVSLKCQLSVEDPDPEKKML